jgi:HAD superfamily hydrolase (TIGR01549 family)
MPLKAVVFDLDGTLASFNVDYMAIRAEVRSLLIGIGLSPSLLSTKESIFEMLKKTEVFLRNNGKPARAFEEIRAKALSVAEKYELEAAKTTSLQPGVKDALDAIKKMSLKVGLCTINSENSTDFILRRFRITDYFDAVVTRNKVKYVKPNTEHLETVLKELGVDASETVVVGDGSGDMKCAKETKAVAVGLPTGISSADDLTNSGADYIIMSIADLPMLIGQLNRA